MKKLILFLIFLCRLAQAEQPSHECLNFEPSKVTITGMITTKDFAGAPNFESIENGDAKETAYILQTSHPICVNGDSSSDTNSESVGNQTEFQLVMTDKKNFDTANQYTNKQISVNGSLFSWVTGHHHTRVLINVDKIVPSNTDMQTPIPSNIQPTSFVTTTTPLVQAESCYKYGMVLEKLTQCANQGNANAQYALGYMYYKGEGVLQDKKKAFEWFSKAAEQGDADAQNSLGVLYYKGEGIPKDWVKAFKWVAKAAEQGNAVAQNQLGIIYEEYPMNGNAIAEYSKAAKKGNVSSMFNLGRMYQKTGERNYTLSYMWFNLAAIRGNDAAIKERDILVKKMTPDQIIKAQQMSTDWLAKHPQK